MEQVLEREQVGSLNIGEIHIFDDDGNEVTNLGLLSSIAEGQEILAEWLKRNTL